MRIGRWARILLAATPFAAFFLTGCGDFWQAPSTSTASSFTMTNSGNVAVSQGATSSGVTITVTPGSSFTGTVTLSCAFTSVPTGATDPTCNFSSSSLTFSSATAQTSTFTLATTSSTVVGAYQITINGVSSGVAASTSFCVEVSTSGTGTCTAASTTSGDFYILNSGTSGSIAGFTITSNALSAISGSSQAVNDGTAVAIAPSGENFLYVASASAGITLYAIDSSTGALGTGVQFNSDSFASALAVSPDGKWLLSASAEGTLTAYPITTAGALDSTRSAQSQPLASTNVKPGEIVISPNGALIAVALEKNGTQIFPFSSDELEAGSVTFTPLNTSGGSAISVAMDPQSRYLYIGEIDANNTANSGSVRIFSISGTSLTTLSPISSGGVSPNAILPDASGDYVYVANGMVAGVAGNVTEFTVASSGLTAGTSVAAGASPLGLAEDSTSGWVFEVGSSGSPYFDAYTLGTSGALTSEVTSTSAATSIAIVAAPKQ